MALSLNFTFGAVCSGGNHVPVTATLSGAVNRAVTFGAVRDTLLAAPTVEDFEAASAVVLRFLIAQLANQSNANIKSKIEAITVNLTVV